jgi:hypothetical protein
MNNSIERTGPSVRGLNCSNMKYFTSEWWAGGCEGADILFYKYNEYFNTIKASLPRPLVELEENHTLHDSEVKAITCDFKEKRVEIELLGWDFNNQFSVRYKLVFFGVSQFEQRLPQLDYVEQELGDLGYWEFELLTGKIEMRMLFASDAEFRIVFNGFDFSFSSRSKEQSVW